MSRNKTKDSTPAQPKRRHTLSIFAVLAIAAAVGVTSWVTPSDFTNTTFVSLTQPALPVEPSLRVTSYKFDEELNQVTVRGKSSLPEKATLVVEVSEFVPGEKVGGPGEKQTVEVGAKGTFEAKVPLLQLSEPDMLFAKVAFDPRWEPNRKFRFLFGDSGKNLWGKHVISDGNAKQLYDDEILFRSPVFPAIKSSIKK